jgi:proteasome lid subunit RPN8/RPN11
MMAKTTKTKIKSQPAVVMESEVARKIRQHSRSSMKAEVCGVLIGSTENERTVVQACITGNNAAQGGTHVTFTQDTWEHIYKIKDREFPDEKIVGWYHSHPGFGVFLSEHDLFIQENFFSSPNQIAWVYDPHTDEEGCFGWVDGKVEKLSGLRFGYSQSVDVAGQSSAASEEMGHAGTELDARMNPQEFSQPQAEPAWVRWTGWALSFLAVALLSATAGYIFGERQVARQVDRELGPALGMCQQIVQHPVEACRALLREVSPAAEAPGGAASDAKSGLQPGPAQNAAPKKGTDGKR